jgi:hypothetical protein
MLGMNKLTLWLAQSLFLKPICCRLNIVGPVRNIAQIEAPPDNAQVSWLWLDRD